MAALLGVGVFSHWILDYLSHRPDLPIGISGDDRAGLGLWKSPGITIVVELAMYAVGIGMYLKATRAKDKAGSVGVWLLLGFLLLIYAASILSPAPPDWHPVAYSGLAAFLILGWAAWADGHREPES